MTLGEKLTKLRKENNYTQEQLADLLGVSRQSISKWESDLAFPETEKIIRLGKMYSCSMDYLLNEEADSEMGNSTETGTEWARGSGEQEDQKTDGSSGKFNLRQWKFERKSKKTIKGLPLWHINIGFGQTAHGFFALGLKARGIFSIGMISTGVFSLGLISLGILPFGVISLGVLAGGVVAAGLLAAGCFAAGIIAIGTIAFGVFSMGAIAIGQFAVGALAIGNYGAIGDSARASIAIGQTEAFGEIYQYVGRLSTGDKNTVIALLDQNVPAWLGWARNLFQVFL